MTDVPDSRQAAHLWRALASLLLRHAVPTDRRVLEWSPERGGAQGRRAPGQHSDPTGSAAMLSLDGPAQQWPRACDSLYNIARLCPISDPSLLDTRSGQAMVVVNAIEAGWTFDWAWLEELRRELQRIVHLVLPVDGNNVRKLIDAAPADLPPRICQACDSPMASTSRSKDLCRRCRRHQRDLLGAGVAEASETTELRRRTLHGIRIGALDRPDSPHRPVAPGEVHTPEIHSTGSPHLDR